MSLQALLRILADPYVLGVSRAARRWASPSRSCSESAPQSSRCRSYLSADFAGSLVALLVIYRMAASCRRLPIHSVLLAGVILNAIFSALIMFITSIMEPNRSFGMMAWLMGSLTAPAYPVLIALFRLFARRPRPAGKHVRVLDILAFR